MKKSEALGLAIISVIADATLDGEAIIEILDVLFDERRSAKWSEAREADNAES